MRPKHFIFGVLFLLLSSCDYFCIAGIIVVNDTNSDIKIQYKIDYNSDSILEVLVKPGDEAILYCDSSSHGMNCESINPSEDKIYLLNILNISNSNDEQCSKAFNKCSEWRFTKDEKMGVGIREIYRLVLREEDFN